MTLRSLSFVLILALFALLARTSPSVAADEAVLDWGIQEEYEQLGHLGSVRTAFTTPPGKFNIETYFRLLSDDVVDVRFAVVEFELGIAENFDMQAGIEFRSEDPPGGAGDENGVGRPFVEFTVQFLDDPGRRQQMATGVRVEFKPIDKDLSGDKIIVEPFFVVNQEIGAFQIFLDLGMRLESSNSHADIHIGTRLPAAENSVLFHGPLDLLLAVNLRFGDDSVVSVTTGLETNPGWFPGNLTAGVTIGLSDDAADWGFVAGIDFGF